VRLAEELSEMYATCGNPSEHLMHDLLFHRYIARASGNPILAGVMEALVDAIFGKKPVRPLPAADLIADARYHHDIFRAIRAHDARRERELMTHHLGCCEAGQGCPLQSRNLA
jgi:GntR family transcriptional regulator, transcriptional repressor for pyruvate dehydrogenase complex